MLDFFGQFAEHIMALIDSHESEKKTKRTIDFIKIELKEFQDFIQVIKEINIKMNFSASQLMC